MKRALAAGLAVGTGLGVLARRWWERRTRYGPWGSLGRGLPGGVDGVGLALVQTTATSLVEGNRVAWRDDAEVFDALEEAIRAARRSVHFDVYIWKPGGAGDRLADLVCRRAREGVRMRILVDPMGSTGFDEQLCPRLREAGCEVRYFRPLKRRPFTFTGRNHRKLVVIDGRVGFTGGFGIAPEWSGDVPGSPTWRDSNVEVEGPVVRQMQVAFANHWIETGGFLLPPVELEWPRPAGEARAAYVTSTDVVGLSHARWVTHVALAAAERRVWIANAYFVPPPEVLGTLCARRAKGVDVRLLLPGPYQDHGSVTFIQRRHYPRLDASGVKVYEYQPSMMHAKTMLIDDRLSLVGSMNLDFMSMEWLEEGALVVDDRTFARAFERRWHEDMARSRQVTGLGGEDANVRLRPDETSIRAGASATSTSTSIEGGPPWQQ
ncbi:phospholipase D-like domain-containing protein [Anaeromyxobacter terrae]|uniref:phospholipase D-like domain-containing protein n=1 Tax=Anaeromyxobacter terrae TaxID=2925406 RepID=UPI001F5691D9|nr:phospholipase D-like domain-containing protein [Anaeromyxobacter sp. SG22]